MPPTTGYANDPVNTASGNFVELEDDLPFDGLTAGLTLRAHVQQPLRALRRVRVRLVVVGGRPPAPARRTAPSTSAPTGSARCSRAWATATGACWASPGSSSRAVRAGAELVRRRALGVRRGRPARARDHAARAPTCASRTRTGAWPSCATRAARPLRVHWSDERIEALECSDGRTSAYRYDDDGELVEARAGARHYEVGDGQGALGHRRRRRRRGRQRLRRAGPRAAPALPVRPQHGLRLPARPGDGRPATTPTARPTSSSTTRPAGCCR